MSISEPIPAVYENGLLRPLQPLSLPERAQVYLTISLSEPLQADVEARLQEMHRQADEWLAQQPQGAVRPPRRLSAAAQARLDAELEALLAEVDASMGDVSEEEVAALANEAVQAVRRSS